MQFARFVLVAALALTATGTRAAVTYSLDVRGTALVWSLESGGDGNMVPWSGQLTIETPDGADGTWFNPQLALESDLAFASFDTRSVPYPTEEVWVTVQGGKVTSLSGEYKDSEVENGYFLRDVNFYGNSMSDGYFDRFNLVDATGALSSVDEPGGGALALAGFAALGVVRRRRSQGVQFVGLAS
jgi:MYXO-CTERM domain-containing protein